MMILYPTPETALSSVCVKLWETVSVLIQAENGSSPDTTDP